MLVFEVSSSPRFKSEGIYSGKDSIRLLAHDKKKKDGKPKKKLARKMFQIYYIYMFLRLCDFGMMIV